MGNDDLCWAWPRNNGVNRAIHSFRHLTSRFGIGDSASVIHPIVVLSGDLAGVEPFLWHAASRTVADFSQVICDFKRALEMFSNDCRSLGGPEKIGAEDFD